MTTPTIDYYFQLAFSSSSRQKYLNFVMADFKTVFLTPFIIFFLGANANWSFNQFWQGEQKFGIQYHFLFYLFLPTAKIIDIY